MIKIFPCILLAVFTHIANADETAEPNNLQLPPTENWESIVFETDSPQSVAVNVSIPKSGSINDFAGSGAATASEQALDSEQVEFDDKAKVTDPWEGYNRSMYGFNSGVDKYVGRPLAVAYDTVTPKYAQARVSSFFSNLRELVTAANQTLQGRPLSGVKSMGRFVVNTTVGVVGLYDPATHFGLTKGNEDFGQTLAVWGWSDSRYFVVPIFGPRTLRDTVGIIGDIPLSPVNQVSSADLMLGLNIMQMTDARTRMFAFDGVRSEAIDEYMMVRDAWMTKRASQVGERR